MATKIKTKVIKGGATVQFLDDDKNIKYLHEATVHINGQYCGIRKLHTGNSNYILAKVVTRVTKETTDDTGVIRIQTVNEIKETAIYHPIKKFVRRTLNAIR